MTEEKQEAKVPVVIGDRGVQINSIDDLWRVSKMAAASGLVPEGMDTPEKIAVAALQGMELGMSFMASVQNIAVINGRPHLWGDMPLGLVRKSGQLESIDESWTGEGKDRMAMCIVKRKGVAEPVGRTFTMEQADKAGLLSKDNWKNYPDRMLQMRARSWALKDLFGDLLKGIAIAEYNEESEPVITEVEEVKPQAPAADLEAAIGTPPQTVGEPVSHEQGADIKAVVVYDGDTEGPIMDLHFDHLSESDFISKWKNLRSGYKQFVIDNTDDFRKLSDKALEIARRKWAKQVQNEAFPPDVNEPTDNEGQLTNDELSGDDVLRAAGLEPIDGPTPTPPGMPEQFQPNPDEIKGADLFDCPEKKELQGHAKRYPKLYHEIVGQRDWTQTTLTELRGILDTFRKKIAARGDVPETF